MLYINTCFFIALTFFECFFEILVLFCSFIKILLSYNGLVRNDKNSFSHPKTNLKFTIF